MEIEIRLIDEHHLLCCNAFYQVLVCSIFSKEICLCKSILKWRIFRAPFVAVQFADFWLADQLNSISFVFADLAFFICVYSTQIDWTTMSICKLKSNSTSQITQENLQKNFVPLYMEDEILHINNTGHNSNLSVGYSLATNCNNKACVGLMFGLEPFLRSLPAWFRFVQCIRRYRDMSTRRVFPHLVNAGKYGSSLLVIPIATILYDQQHSNSDTTTMLVLVILAHSINSIYCYFWDIFMDWSLLDFNFSSRVNRDELVYRFRYYYYLAAIEDLLIRLSWVLIIWLTYQGSKGLELVKSTVAILEVIRRFIWNFFRLENEHLNNCGQFRAVRDINIGPIPKPPATPKNTNRSSRLLHTLKNASRLPTNVHSSITLAWNNQRNTNSLHNIHSAADLLKYNNSNQALFNSETESTLTQTSNSRSKLLHRLFKRQVRTLKEDPITEASGRFQRNHSVHTDDFWPTHVIGENNVLNSEPKQSIQDLHNLSLNSQSVKVTFSACEDDSSENLNKNFDSPIKPLNNRANSSFPQFERKNLYQQQEFIFFTRASKKLHNVTEEEEDSPGTTQFPEKTMKMAKQLHAILKSNDDASKIPTTATTQETNSKPKQNPTIIKTDSSILLYPNRPRSPLTIAESPVHLSSEITILDANNQSNENRELKSGRVFTVTKTNPEDEPG